MTLNPKEICEIAQAVRRECADEDGGGLESRTSGKFDARFAAAIERELRKRWFAEPAVLLNMGNGRSALYAAPPDCALEPAPSYRASEPVTGSTQRPDGESQANRSPTAEDDDWDEPEPKYFNEAETCGHGLPNWTDCDWCKAEKDELY